MRQASHYKRFNSPHALPSPTARPVATHNTTQSLTLTQAPRSVALRGGGAAIAAAWDAATAGLSAGDLVVLDPAGGVLELDQPLTVAGDVVVTGAGGGVGSGKQQAAGGGRRLLAAAAPVAGAPAGAATVKCAAGGSGAAFRVM